MKVEVQFNVFYDDLDSQTEPVDLTSGESREKTEVNVRRVDEDSLGQFTQAKTDELDQWISHGVVSICDRGGIPIGCMRWICTWKPPSRKAHRKTTCKSTTGGTWLTLSLTRHQSDETCAVACGRHVL